MAIVKLDLTEEQMNLFKYNGTVIRNGEKYYYFLPAWIEYDEDTKEYCLHQLGELPENLKVLIKHFRTDTKHDE